jgi:hypothetical protein
MARLLTKKGFLNFYNKSESAFDAAYRKHNGIDKFSSYNYLF